MPDDGTNDELVNLDEYQSVFKAMINDDKSINNVVVYKLINIIMSDSKYVNVKLSSLSDQIETYLQTNHTITKEISEILHCDASDEEPICQVCFEEYSNQSGHKPQIICPKNGHCACQTCLETLIQTKLIQECIKCRVTVSDLQLYELGLVDTPPTPVPVTGINYIRFLKFDKLITNNINLFKSFYEKHMSREWSYRHTTNYMSQFAPKIADTLYEFVKKKKFNGDEMEYLQSVNLSGVPKMKLTPAIKYIDKSVFGTTRQGDYSNQYFTPLNRLSVNYDVKSNNIKYIECQLFFMLPLIHYELPTEFNFRTARAIFTMDAVTTTREIGESDDIYINRLLNLVRSTYLINHTDSHYKYKQFMHGFLCSDVSVIRLFLRLQNLQVYDLYNNTPFFKDQTKYTGTQYQNTIINKTHDALCDMMTENIEIIKKFFENRHKELDLRIKDVQRVNEHYPLENVIIPPKSSVFLRACLTHSIILSLFEKDRPIQKFYALYLYKDYSNLKKKYGYKKFIEETNELVLQTKNRTNLRLVGGEKKDSNKWQCIALGLVITIACAIIQ